MKKQLKSCLSYTLLYSAVYNFDSLIRHSMSALNKSTINGVHFGPVKRISLAPDNHYLLSLGSTDGIINVIDFDNFDISPDFNTASITDDQIFSFYSIEKKNSLIITDDGKQILNVSWPDISQTSQISETDMPMTVLAANSNGNLIAVSGEDPQVTIINLENPEDQTPLFDNIKAVTYIGFGPVCQTLVTINEDGDIFTYSASDSYQEVKYHKIKVKTVLPGVCWSIDSQLLIADSEQKGIFHVFHFPSDGYTTGKFQNLGIITALSISNSFLLAACDSSQKVVISQFSENFIQNQQLPILQIFDPKIQPITTLYWADNYLIAGDSEGSIHKWDAIQTDNAKEIEVVTSIMESDNELQEIESSDDQNNDISKTKHIILSGKHKAETPKSHRKQDDSESSDEEEDYDDEEEEELENRRSRNPYIIDEASEASTDYDYDNGPSRKKQSNIPDFRPKISAEEFAERIKKNLNIKEYSTTPTETENEDSDNDPDKPLSKEEIRARREEDRREARLDRQFIVHSGSEVSEENDIDEEEEDTVEAVTDSEEDIQEAEDNEPIQFMPGSTDDFENKRRFLCFNLIAKIFLRENADESTSIDIEYSDRSKYRSVHFENKERYVLGTVTSSGVTLASRSRVYYKPHNSWATDCECMIKMEKDEFVDLIAAGNDWFAASTNFKRLRIFMGSGLEIAIIAIPQRPMSMTAGDDLLFIVFGDKYNDDLTYWLLDVKKRRLLANGLLPISKIVNWMGFDERTFYVLGNNHVLYALVNDFGFQFVPICNVQSTEEDNAEFWAVGVNRGKLLGVFLPEKRKFPEPITNLKLDELTFETQCADEESSDYILKRIIFCNSTKSDRETAAVKMDTELLKQFAEAAKNRLYQKMYQIGLQITSKKGQKITLDFIRQKDDEYQEIADKLEEYWLSINHFEEEETIEQQEQNENEDEVNNDNNNEEETIYNDNESKENEAENSSEDETFTNDYESKENEVKNNNEDETNYNNQADADIEVEEVFESTEVVTKYKQDGEIDSTLSQELLHRDAQIVDDDEEGENNDSNVNEQHNNDDENTNSEKEKSEDGGSDDEADSLAEDEDSIE